MHTKGFTYVEALLIIVVLVILAAILFPIFARPHGARVNSCLNNQRQLAIAASMYLEVNEETYFPDPKRTAWAPALKPYNEPSLYDCPTLTGKAVNENPEYGFNANLFSMALGDIHQPDKTLYLADLKRSGMFGNYTLTSHDPADPHYFATVIDPRHNNGFAYSCVDGHIAVAYVKTGETPAQALKRDGIVLNPASLLKP
jgi:type II secretory pathway pseudopilin PulG